MHHKVNCASELRIGRLIAFRAAWMNARARETPCRNKASLSVEARLFLCSPVNFSVQLVFPRLSAVRDNDVNFKFY